MLHKITDQHLRKFVFLWFCILRNELIVLLNSVYLLYSFNITEVPMIKCLSLVFINHMLLCVKLNIEFT